MSEGQDPEPTGPVITVDSNWVRGFFAVPIVHRPGTQFLYNSLGVYMLAAIVEKVTGQKIIDYLTPRLFQPLGIQGADWEVSPQGIGTGGWGLRLKTEDLAKVGQLYLRKGAWNGRQLLPAKWIDEATSISIMQPADPASKTSRDSSDWLQGYGYLFWHCRQKNVYRADGAFGQYIIIMPDQDAVVAITSETGDMQDELNLVWRYILPSIHTDPSSSPTQKEALPADPAAETALKQQLSSLTILPPSWMTASPAATTLAGSISGKTFTVAPNAEHISRISFSFSDQLCHLTLTTDTATYQLSFGQGKWEKGTTTLHGPHLTSLAKASMTGLAPFRTVGSYRWKDDNTIELVLRFIESPHTRTISCHFDQNKMSATVQNSFSFGKSPTVWEGVIQ